ncbi:hypothetical protein ABZT04_27265 [Streptomyces sp. NPDC005492]|uniref:hypothetical protein n=1 Tax=Streptomyces sp. NPDC005492 TaxID=3156883 RepID=UPI0033A1936E
MPAATTTQAPATRADRRFGALFAGYTMAGVGHIVAGTLLVAAIGQGPRSARRRSEGARRADRRTVLSAVGPARLLCVALLIQAVGITLSAPAARAHLRIPGSVALLTAGHTVGQTLGPLAVGATLMVLAATAAVPRIGFPHHAVAVRNSAPDQGRRTAPTDAGR